jgi:hypothetical protein
MARETLSHEGALLRIVGHESGATQHEVAIDTRKCPRDRVCVHPLHRKPQSVSDRRPEEDAGKAVAKIERTSASLGQRMRGSRHHVAMNKLGDA